MGFLLAAGAAALVCAQASASTVWLCHPGQKADPCTRSLSFTAVNGSLSLRRYDVGARRAQPIDCFYAYPSVSTENRGSVRRHLVSAILVGANVRVGKNGDFRRVPPCASASQTGCVVKTPPADASFERASTRST
jgi:hypothetical protein